jgi:hypothetical protein
VALGNNSTLIKELLKKRPWWTIVETFDASSLNFAWSQLRIKEYFKFLTLDLKVSPLTVRNCYNLAETPAESLTSTEYKNSA